MTPPAAQPPGRLTLLALAGIAALGSMAIHMLVPALPLLAHDLDVGQAEAQLAISLYLAGLGGGQLLAGLAADRLGRRPVLLAGIILYLVGAFASAAAQSLPWLLGARLVQALGGAAGVVTARVMVGDLFGRGASASKQATLMMVVLVSPALAPVVGGVLAAAGGWRVIPAALGVAAGMALMIALVRLPESSRASLTGDAATLRHSLARLARNRAFVCTTLALAGGSSTLYMFLSSAAFLLVNRFGLTIQQAGPCFLIVAASSIAGTRLVAPLGRRGDALHIGMALIATGTVTELALALVGIVGATPLIGPMLLVGVGAGIVGPSAITIVIFAEEGLAATATSLAGAGQMLGSSLAVATLGLFAPVTPVKLAVAMACSAAVAFGADLARSRKVDVLQGLTVSGR